MNSGEWPNDQILKSMKIHRAYNLGVAKALLGTADTEVAEINADRNLELAWWIMRKIGRPRTASPLW